jgi:hypothetical protein
LPSKSSSENSDGLVEWEDFKSAKASLLSGVDKSKLKQKLKINNRKYKYKKPHQMIFDLN